MLAADVAKISLAELADDAAESALIEMRATVIFVEGKMRRVAADALLYIITVAARESGIFRHCKLVDVDLPANATAMGTFVGDAGKIKIIFRC